MTNEIDKNSYLETLYKKYGEDFFKEEVRSDFLVTTERKEIWAVLLDLLEHFIEICNQHKLQYFIGAGVLLGTVRHGGFIPWDDDMDVFMLREDYDRLMEYKDEFSYPFFLQTPYTDKHCAISIAKLRNSETSMIDPTYLRRNEIMNMGIALDIFPLDKVRKKDAKKIREEIFPLTLKGSAYMKHNAVLLTDRDRLQVEQYYDAQITPAELYKKINEIACRYQNDISANYRAELTNTICEPEHVLWPEACFNHAIYMPFEMMSVSVPTGYDEILRIIYGNYMEYPPVSERGQWHGRLIFRPDTPYLQAINEYQAALDREENK